MQRVYSSAKDRDRTIYIYTSSIDDLVEIEQNIITSLRTDPPTVSAIYGKVYYSRKYIVISSEKILESFSYINFVETLYS